MADHAQTEVQLKEAHVLLQRCLILLDQHERVGYAGGRRLPVDMLQRDIRAALSPVEVVACDKYVPPHKPTEMGHDGINAWICQSARLTRYGIPKDCPTCEGRGSLFTEPAARLTLTLWWLHPRKGCSRGIEVRRIEREELPEVYAFLREAADRNASRFRAVVGSRRPDGIGPALAEVPRV